MVEKFNQAIKDRCNILSPYIDVLDAPTHLDTNAENGNCFLALAKSIAGQQISMKAAASIWAKVLANMEDHSAMGFLNTPIENLRTLGLSTQKANYLHNISNYFIENDITDSQLFKYEDQVIINMLTSIKGVGVWTVQMLLIFNLGRPDVWPISDLGIRKALMQVYNLPQMPTLKDASDLGLRFANFRSYAAHYLWQSLALPK